MQKFQDDFHPADIAHAILTLSRLPMPIKLADRAPISGIWAFPLVGALIGFLAAGALNILSGLYLPSGFEAAIVMMLLIGLTGAMHEDGLADTFDGLWGGHDKDARLAIMKDSRIGTYGLCAILVFALAEWSAIEALSEAGLVAIMVTVCAVSRVPMAIAMWGMSSARAGGLSDSFGQPKPIHVIGATLIAAVIALIAIGWLGLLCLIGAMLAALPIALIAQAKIGGQTGDILGAMQKCATLGAFLPIFAL